MNEHAKTAQEWVRSYSVMYQYLEQDDLLINALAIKKVLKNAYRVETGIIAHESFKLAAMKSLMSYETINKLYPDPWYSALFKRLKNALNL
jgi:hypothetical protein